MDTSDLMHQLQEDYLRCKICLQEFTHPKALPACLHTYCEGCLRGYIYSRSYDTTGRFPCPECRREVAIPDQGVAGFPDNHMVVSLLDTVTQQGGGGESDAGLTVPTAPAAPPVPPAPAPPPVNNTNNVNLNLNYQGTINVNNTHSQGGATPNNRIPQPTHMVDPVRPPSVGPRPPPRTTPRTGTPPGGTPASTVSARSGRLYPVLPTSDTESVVPSPARSATTPRRPAPPPPRVRPGQVDLPPATVPVAYNRHGAILCFGQWGDGLADFSKPVGMALSPHGYVIVTDRRDNRILIFEKTGKLRSILSTNGRLQDVAVNSRGNLVCANTKIANALAVEYDMSGKIVRTYGEFFTYEKPHGIAVTRRDALLVTTLETKLVYRLGADGKMLQKLKAKSREGLGLHKPLYVATNYAEDLIVADEAHHCVRVFNKIGGLRFQIGGRPAHKHGSLRHPLGVCTDPAGNIIVADAGNHRVQLFSPGGKFLDVLVEIRREVPGCELKPQNVAVQGDKLVVLVVGPQYAQVRVYAYHPDIAKYQLCACQ